MLLPLLAAGYLALFALLVRSLCARPHRRRYTLYKTLVSLGFIAVALACAAHSGAWGQALAMLPALVLYLAGDVLLGLNNKKHSTRLFAAGALAFFAGHIWLIGVLRGRAALPLPWLAVPCAVAAAVAAVLWGKRPRLPGYYYPGMVGYGFTVALFAAQCAAVAAALPGAQGTLLAVGGGLFVASDCIIPLVHFVPRRSLWAHLLNLTCYYGGMFLLAASLYFAR